MPRSYDMATDYGNSVEEVHAAFADKRYWLARLDESGVDVASLDQLETGDDGGIDIATTQTVHFYRLPAMVSQFHHGDLTLVRAESWSPIRGGRASATVTGVVRGAPARISATAQLVPTGTGSRIDVNAIIEVRIPLVGGRVESLLGGQLMEMLTLEQRFTTAWIRDNT